MPSSLAGGAGKVATVNSGGTAYELVTPDPLIWARDWVSVESYGAAGVITTTTLNGGVLSGAITATLTDASSFAVGHGMAIPGAGVAGVELIVDITGVTGNVVIFTPATSTTVSTGITVYHDDTAAIVAALATGKHTYLSAGDYHTTSIITIFTNRQTLAGEGMFTRTYLNASIIYPRSLTADVIHLYASSAPALIGLRILQSGTATAGAGIVVGQTGTRTSSSRIRYVSVAGTYDGLIIRDGFTNMVRSSSFGGTRRRTIWINTPIPEGNNKFVDVGVGGATGVSGTVGIYIDGADHNEWDFIWGGTGLDIGIHLNSTYALIAEQNFDHIYLDDLQVTGIKVTKGAFSCVSNSFAELHMYLATTGCKGIVVETGAELTRFSGVTMIGLAGAGVEDSGTRTILNDVHLRPSINSTNTYDAITLKAASIGAKVTNCSGVYSRYGLVVESGVTYATIKDNDFRNNGTGAASIASGVMATCIIKDNQGLTNWLTSIAATPEAIGLEALVSGIWYKAIATSSTADWKALN